VAEKAQELVDGVLVKVSSTVNKDDVKKNIQNRFYKNNASLKSSAEYFELVAKRLKEHKTSF